MYRNQVTPIFWEIFPSNPIPSEIRFLIKNNIYLPVFVALNLICVWNIHFLDIFFAMGDGWRSNMFGDT